MSFLFFAYACHSWTRFFILVSFEAYLFFAFSDVRLDWGVSPAY